MAKSIEVVLFVLRAALVLSWVAVGDENEYQTAKPETENPPEDQDSSPSFHDELPEQPTLRQVLESMKVRELQRQLRCFLLFLLFYIF